MITLRYEALIDVVCERESCAGSSETLSISINAREHAP